MNHTRTNSNLSAILSHQGEFVLIPSSGSVSALWRSRDGSLTCSWIETESCVEDAALLLLLEMLPPNEVLTNLIDLSQAYVQHKTCSAI